MLSYFSRVWLCALWTAAHQAPLSTGFSAAAKSLQSCPTLCDPIDGSLPGSAISGILQARTLEWVAISFSNAWKWKVKVKSLCRFWLLATPWTAAYQAPPSMGFSKQEYWSGVPLPSPTGFSRQDYWHGLPFPYPITYYRSFQSSFNHGIFFFPKWNYKPDKNNWNWVVLIKGLEGLGAQSSLLCCC